MLTLKRIGGRGCLRAWTIHFAFTGAGSLTVRVMLSGKTSAVFHCHRYHAETQIRWRDGAG